MAPLPLPLPLTPDAGLGQGVFSVDADLGSGYAQQWNLTVQRELTKNMVVEVAYAGSKITHVGIPEITISCDEKYLVSPCILANYGLENS